MASNIDQSFYKQHGLVR